MKHKHEVPTIGIDGDQWYILFGDNLQKGHAYFAKTFGEIRKLVEAETGRELGKFNNILDGMTAEQYKERA